MALLKLELELELFLQSIGVLGIIVFYIVLTELSARMGEGLGLPKYYRLNYVACVIAFSTILLHIYQHYMKIFHGSLLDLVYLSMLFLSNITIIIVSKKYWWWLKDEIFKTT